MKEVFANLYNKVVSFFHQSENNEGNSKDVARNRLKLVLMQDKANLTPAIMDRMRRELIELLSKYMELDNELLDLNFENEDDQMALMLSIPVIRAKTEDEILEILDKEDAEKKKSEDDSEEEDEEESEDDNDESKTEEETTDVEEVSEKEETEEYQEDSNEVKDEESDEEEVDQEEQITSK